MGLFAPPPKPAPTPPPPARAVRKGLPWEIRLLLYVAVIGALGLGGALVYYTTVFPNPMALRGKERAPVVRVLARDGAVLAERGSASEYVPIDLMPRHLIDAVVATEDRRFFKHWGLDPWGLLRAAYANARARRLVEGGSTITQQLAKNLFLNSERTLNRKLEEVVLALWLEMRLGKRDILELYLNRVYFGGGAYGVEAAAKRFFGKSVQEITLAQAAVLAGLLKAPSRFSPAGNPTLAGLRARSVLNKMVEAGLLAPGRAEMAAAAPVRFADNLAREASGAEYAVDAALEKLPALSGTEAGPLIVETTIDADLQRRAQAIVSDLLAGEGRSVEASQAGLVLMDLEGGIRALVGGRAYAESQFNRATKARRQPGSAFKPFVYLAALESGLTPDSMVQDVPMLGSGWSPRNEDGRYRGAITMREALSQSVNVAAVRLNMQVGPRRTASVARRLGIRSVLREEASLALGTSEVTLTELAGAYGVFASGGREVDPHIVVRVRSGSGRVLFERRKPRARVLVGEQQVGDINSMLNAVLVSGTGRRAALPRHPAAGKTGTSQDFRDAWFVGYTAHFVAGVWTGNDDSRPMNRVMGGTLPARIWHDVMVPAHEGRSPAPLPGAPQAIAGTARTTTGTVPERSAAAEPLMPKERIGRDFVARMLDTGGPSDVQDRPPVQRSWLDKALAQIRRTIGQ